MAQPRRNPSLPRFGEARRRAARTRREPLPASLRVRPPGPERPQRPVSRPAFWWPVGVAASLLIHALLLAALLLGWLPRPQEPTPLPAPSFEIEFENRSGTTEPQASGAPEGEQVPPAPPAPAMAPPPSPPAPAVPDAPPVPAPPATQAPAAPPVPPPPAPLPPAPAPPRSEAPRPPLPPAALPGPPPPPPAPAAPRTAEAPPPPAPAAPSTVEEPPPPPAERPQQAAPRPGPRPSQPRPAVPMLPEGFDLSRPSAPAGRPTGPRAPMDLSVDPRFFEGRPTTNSTVVVRGQPPGENWMNAYRRWLDQNLFYPMDAAQRGESGQVTVRFTVMPDGRVTQQQVTWPSTSPSLNSNSVRPFVGARLPPLPPGASPEGTVMELRINYVIVWR